MRDDPLPFHREPRRTRKHRCDGLLRGLREIPNIVGLKDEHGDMRQFVRQWRSAGDRLELLCGVGEILAPSYFALGVKGFTSGIVNFMPRTPLRIMELLRTGQLKAAMREWFQPHHQSEGEKPCLSFSAHRK